MAVAATGDLERRLNTVRAWAEKRAIQFSEEPGDYMDFFEGELERLIRGADPDRQVRDFSDPVLTAAQIEAASAARAIVAWGTGKGLCPRIRRPDGPRR